eukprot:TRINITY_DN430_c0_g1_i1.p3 TRINITY_DN430_c0_g1~~TRINITY_DN430_c0_g1_i1.p3  ORF type:complete len:120 (-),score=49.08 TRINITY_DN430_c0_g1_i1:89-448(-)
MAEKYPTEPAPGSDLTDHEDGDRGFIKNTIVATLVTNLGLKAFNKFRKKSKSRDVDGNEDEWEDENGNPCEPPADDYKKKYDEAIAEAKKQLQGKNHTEQGLFLNRFYGNPEFTEQQTK